MSNDTPHRLLVVGAGTMGAQIALQAALHGVGVDLVDISPDALDKGRRQIEGLVRRNVGKGRQTAEEAAATLARLTFSSDMDTAAPRCDWAIEAVVERLDVKQAVFNQLAKLLPAHAGIATNSSHIRVATIVGDADHRPRALNMHFFHPVVVMDLVEIVASPHTDEAILRRRRPGRTGSAAAPSCCARTSTGSSSTGYWGGLAGGVLAARRRRQHVRPDRPGRRARPAVADRPVQARRLLRPRRPARLPVVPLRCPRRRG